MIFLVYKLQSAKGKLIGSLLFFVLFFPSISSAQELAGPPFRIAFKWAPFGVFDFFSGPNMKLGLDYRYSKTTFGGIDGGMIFLPYPQKNNIGFFARKELKFFISANKSESTHDYYYWGFEGMYKYQEFDRSDSIAIPGIAHSFKSYHMYKNTFALHIKTGGIIYFATQKKKFTSEKDMPKFFLEFFAGAGVRQSTGKCAGLSDTEADNRKMTVDLSNLYNARNGTFILPSFELSLKFGWHLLRAKQD